ncbi:Putative NAD(P)H-dependent FMN-containing oxidoreductase YwqN [Sporomusa silvacetica DSM 10669]|uniref:NAD(P)H-dependent FMN-containing oxidoreductase YwqN n=1 Tax=Sporomusa silvacetica DSM 10669 TaxID=1123289 RepID=A0ABZ3IQV6_9FIRM|nr:flavodoxin family protein [Sporomusa silvacetica]OZC16323.1 putative NAD(P)H-dependent FMN-containing oxidoreductase YwqN [Sporomusa silvacetica DSM 10669]
MSKKILILSGSPREEGNSDVLCEQFKQGAQEAGHKVEKIFINDKKIHACVACYACRGNGTCAFKDDMAEILEKMVQADVIVLASPVYFYSINGQIKILIDRTVARYTEIRNKELYYIITAADTSIPMMQRSIECFRGFADCLGGSQEKGIVYGVGAWNKGEIQKTKAMQEAFEMGRRA